MNAIINGLFKYSDNVLRDSLPLEDKRYRPLYLSKEFLEADRQLFKQFWSLPGLKNCLCYNF